MIVSTTDPISLVDLKNPEAHPFVVESDGVNALKIYFENEENKRAYLGEDVEQPNKPFEAQEVKPV